MSPCLKRQFYKLLKLFRARSLALTGRLWLRLQHAKPYLAA